MGRFLPDGTKIRPKFVSTDYSEFEVKMVPSNSPSQDSVTFLKFSNWRLKTKKKVKV